MATFSACSYDFDNTRFEVHSVLKRIEWKNISLGQHFGDCTRMTKDRHVQLGILIAPIDNDLDRQV